MLVLGSMPSVRSLAEGRYYAHPRNRFWPMMGTLLAGSPGAIPYEAAPEALARAGISLWDTVGSCLRSGSLDSAIREALPNDIPGFLDSHPGVEAVMFNGRKSAEVFRRAFGDELLARRSVRAICLPSTSPANASWSLERLCGAWGKALSGCGIRICRQPA